MVRLIFAFTIGVLQKVGEFFSFFSIEINRTHHCLMDIFYTLR